MKVPAKWLRRHLHGRAGIISEQERGENIGKFFYNVLW